MPGLSQWRVNTLWYSGMQPGDDEWIMVEDEFLATANLFTRSLHEAEYAEYEKLSAAAKSKHARRISRIQRPTSSARSSRSRDLLKKREYAALERLRQSGAIEEEEEEEMDYSSELGALMKSGVRKEASLLGKMMRPTQAVTRAAAGYTGSSQREISSLSQMATGPVSSRPPKRVPGTGVPSSRSGPAQPELGNSNLDVDDDLDEPAPPPVHRMPSATKVSTVHPSRAADRSSVHPKASTSRAASAATSSRTLSSAYAHPTGTSAVRPPSNGFHSSSHSSGAVTVPRHQTSSSASKTLRPTTSTTSSITPLDSLGFSTFEFNPTTSRYRGKSAAAKQRALTAAASSNSVSSTTSSASDLGTAETEKRRKSGEIDMVKVLGSMRGV